MPVRHFLGKSHLTLKQCSDLMASSSCSSQNKLCNEKQKQGLSFTDYLRGLSVLLCEIFFEKITSSNLQNPLPLSPLSDLTCIVTGPTSGIGLEIARNLAFSGAHLVMAARNQKAAHDLINQWNHGRSSSSDTDSEAANQLNIEVMELDLLSLQSVVKFAHQWNSSSRPLNVLINNAGILSMGKPHKLSEDGFETHLQVNHLAPALLSILLLPSLKKGSPSRIVNNSSTGHFLGFVDVDDMNFTSGRRTFSSFKAYASSKLAQVMVSSILQKKLPEKSGISVVCASPGCVRKTNVARDIPKMVPLVFNSLLFFLYTPKEGSRSLLYAATHPQVQDYTKSLKAQDSPVCAYMDHDCSFGHVSKEAQNLETSMKVWDRTLDMTGLPSDVVDKLLSEDAVEVSLKDRSN
ncbi:dehydrogenase/reductase SDR family member FEY-like [Prosopis cineraria]|uniref:dehydrogenase/reductase SDR family member FEY-like n=1 Tax=Prosopis cineraria TaxID=364024 RepID=UPI00241039EA|nr:dehydrogenase/reductase SDR family member FEY-like [Prosopis cineraria]